MRRSILLLAAAALSGCAGDDTLDPQDRVIAVGTYSYEGRWLHPVRLEWDTIRGQLVLDAATPDSVHGHWQIAGFVADSVGGYWNENAYVLGAASDDGAITVTHRLSRIGSPAELRCTLTFTEEQEEGTLPVTTGGTCDADPSP